jgi:hypothetical protein
MGTMLGLWEDPATGEILHSICLTAAHEPLAMERLMDAFASSVLAVVSDSLEGPERNLRASLTVAQIIGVAMTRYVWGSVRYPSYRPKRSPATSRRASSATSAANSNQRP